MRHIFVNLPVRDVKRSRAFFGALGFSFNDTYSDEQVLCVALETNIFVMLMEEERFSTFINGDIGDPATTEVLTCLTVETVGEVERLMEKAMAAGARPWRPVIQEGGMYVATFQDPDGHVWELLAMPEVAVGDRA